MTNKNKNSLLLGISVGDLNGIGVEIILKTFKDNRLLEFCTPVLFANTKIISYLKRALKLDTSIVGIEKLTHIQHGKINVLNIWREGVDLSFGVNDKNVGKYAVKSFQRATKALQENEIDVLVTAPINKYTIQSEDFSFPGHTNYLNQELEGEAMMLMLHKNLRIGLATEHIPVKNIAEKITADLLRKKITSLHQILQQDFGITKPKIAVLGLNPHCGDNGVIGKEEKEIIQPEIEKLFNEKHLVFGPYSADAFFGSNQYKKFDGILAMYHDQGLIPFKTLAFGKGVNFTAGLSKIRTSPDHGTAFDIAGKGIANESSFREAVYKAIDIFKKRNEFKQLTKNKLKPKQKDFYQKSKK